MPHSLAKTFEDNFSRVKTRLLERVNVIRAGWRHLFFFNLTYEQPTKIKKLADVTESHVWQREAIFKVEEFPPLSFDSSGSYSDLQ